MKEREKKIKKTPCKNIEFYHEKNHFKKFYQLENVYVVDLFTGFMKKIYIFFVVWFVWTNGIVSIFSIPDTYHLLRIRFKIDSCRFFFTLNQALHLALAMTNCQFLNFKATARILCFKPNYSHSNWWNLSLSLDTFYHIRNMKHNAFSGNSLCETLLFH